MSPKRSKQPTTTTSPDELKIFCGVFSISTRHHKAKGQAVTWGKRCDGFVIFSNASDPSINAIEFPVEGGERYGNMWRKSRDIWSAVAESFLSDQSNVKDSFDWFLLGGDDFYLAVHNLRAYLSSEEIISASGDSSTPLYLGRPVLTMQKNIIYNAGGCGYLLNRMALRLLISAFKTGICSSYNEDSSVEDVLIAACLSQYNIFPQDTRDYSGSDLIGLDRFHFRSPQESYDFIESNFS